MATVHRFIATLVSTQAGGVLSVVETNNFRQLYHISLQLRAGNDNEIKRYLAGRVRSFKVRAAVPPTACRLRLSCDRGDMALRCRHGRTNSRTP